MNGPLGHAVTATWRVSTPFQADSSVFTHDGMTERIALTSHSTGSGGKTCSGRAAAPKEIILDD